MDKTLAIKRGIKRLLMFCKTPLKSGESGTGGDNAFYGAVFESKLKKTPWRTRGNVHPCHAYMSHYKNPVVVFNRFCHRSDLSDEARRCYFDWITGDNSPWREFHGRNISHVPSSHDGPVLDWVYTHGWVWSELEKHPSNLQHSFLTAARMVSEWPALITQWYNWVQKGCHPALAFVFLTLFYPLRTNTNYWGSDHGYTGAEGFDLEKWQINRQNRYDWPVDPCTAGEEYIKNFMNGRVEALNKPYSEDSQYTPVNRIFGDNKVVATTAQAYPSVLFRLYSPTHGPGAAETEAYWEQRGTGFSSFSLQHHWYVSEDDIIDIIKKEEVRLNGNEDTNGNEDDDSSGVRRTLLRSGDRDSKGRFTKRDGRDRPTRGHPAGALVYVGTSGERSDPSS